MTATEQIRQGFYRSAAVRRFAQWLNVAPHPLIACEIAAGYIAAARWNQELYANINNGAGGEEPWGNDMYRIDVALGYRFTRHLQTKLQYSFGHRPGALLQQGEQLVAAQATVKF